MVPKKTELEDLKSNKFMELMEFAFKKMRSGESFTEEDVTKNTSLIKNEFDAIRQEVAGSVDTSESGIASYSMHPNAFLNYLDFISLQDARASASEANTHATKAQKTATVSIWISGGLALVSIILSITN